MTDKLATIPEALDDIRRGKMVILVDDKNRENEGVVVLSFVWIGGTGR